MTAATPKRERTLGALLTSCAIAFATPPAAACSQCESRIPVPGAHIVTSPWPRPGLDAVASAAVGSCWRQDPNVPGSGVCGDFFFGIDAALPKHLRVTAELGTVLTHRVQSGLPFNGTSHVSGGTYLGGRLFVGYDFTRLFFTRVGWELRTTVDTGVTSSWVLELGTRILGHLEIGVRAKAGLDSVTTRTFINAGRDTNVGVGFAQGAFLFVRAFR